MSFVPALICNNCYRRTKNMNAVIDHGDGITGYLCEKCSVKHEVKDRPKGVSWRQAVSDLLMLFSKKGKGKL